jgi:hypothetical protein
MGDSSPPEHNALLILSPGHERSILVPSPLCDADLRMAKMAPMLAVDAWHRWCELARQMPNLFDPAGLFEVWELVFRRDDPISREMTDCAVCMIRTLVNAGMSGAIAGSYRTVDGRADLRTAHWDALFFAKGRTRDVINLFDDELRIGERRFPDVKVHLVPFARWLAYEPKPIDQFETPKQTEESPGVPDTPGPNAAAPDAQEEGAAAERKLTKENLEAYLTIEHVERLKESEIRAQAANHFNTSSIPNSLWRPAWRLRPKTLKFAPGDHK